MMEGTQKRGEERREKKKDGKERKRVEKVLERQTRGERERGKTEGKITESYSQKLLNFSASIWNIENSRSLD